MQEAIERLMINRTVIVIAHRLSTIRNADLIAVCGRGTVLEMGSHDELMTHIAADEDASSSTQGTENGAGNGTGIGAYAKLVQRQL